MDPAHSVVSHLLQGKKGTVLDAGAGSGDLTKLLKEQGFTVTSCDAAPEGFSVPGMTCDTVDLNKPFPYKKPFDHIVCVEVIEHLENPFHLLRECSRLLKPGGTLIVSTPNIANIFSRLKFLVTGEFFLFSKAERDSGHIRPVVFWEMQDLFKKHGFSLQSIHTNNYLKLCGHTTQATKKKRFLSKLAYLLLFPILRPKNKILLQGDSLIYVAVKEAL